MPSPAPATATIPAKAPENTQSTPPPVPARTSLSPQSTDHAPTYQRMRPRTQSTSSTSRVLRPFDSTRVHVLLLENISQTAEQSLREQGYKVDHKEGSMNEDELIACIGNYQAIGIRSKTKITRRVIDSAPNLLVIGCFCIGTNQVDIEYAASKGVAVFNSPFSNSRSVAELVIAEIVFLARQIGDRNIEMHKGIWRKVSKSCHEIRGKTLGIVGYGHIGSQLSVLAESFGMNVIFFDVVPLMALGMARQKQSLHELLSEADFVTLHVPESPETRRMISTKEFESMKDGAFLINASRGHVVDVPALINASHSGKLRGAALDVYPNEPAANGASFNSTLNEWIDELMSLKNVILTPHIGGSTEEAQYLIGEEVSNAFAKYINEGISTGAVNFPEVSLRPISDNDIVLRVLFIHDNVPGVLKQVNNVLSDHNILAQYSDSCGSIAYLMADISNVTSDEMQTLYKRLSENEHSLRLRLLY